MSTTSVLENKDASAEFEESVKVFVPTPEQAEALSKELAAVYEAALGKGGVKAAGHEAYPDADLFDPKAIKHILETGERTIGVAQVTEDGKKVLAGAMVADRLSPHHVEFNSMVVPVKRRGLKLGSHIVRGLADVIDQEKFVVNCTELVTHSMASQAAHFHNGFRAICGFGFCHYPRVFFKDHPESVLWSTRLQGKLVPAMRKFRSFLGRRLGSEVTGVKHKVMAAQASGSMGKNDARLDEESLNLVAEVLKERTAYVPKRYNNLVQSILFQFEDVLDTQVTSSSGACKSVGYTESEDACQTEAKTAKETAPTAAKKDSKTQAAAKTTKAETDFASLKVEPKDGFGHAYILFNPKFEFCETELDQALAQVHSLDKRYIKVCIPADTPEAIRAAEALLARGFVFHSYLPLYGYAEQELHSEEGQPARKAAAFYDILSLQWIEPNVLKQNPLPGETDSVVKLYGYPENLSGPIVRTIAQELDETMIKT